MPQNMNYPYANPQTGQSMGLTALRGLLPRKPVDPNIPATDPESFTTDDINLPDYTMNQRADALIQDIGNRGGENRDYSQPQQSAVQGLQAAQPQPKTPVTDPTGFQSSSTANAPIQLAQLQQQQLNEQQDRLFNQQRAQGGARSGPTSGPFADYGGNAPSKTLDTSAETGALKGLIGRTQEDIAGDPFTGEAAQAQTAGVDKSILGARLGGYGSPQEAAEAARQAETYKQDAPVRAQQMAGQYDLQKQQEASRGALDVAKEQQSGIANRYQAIQDLLQGGGLGNLRSISPTGGMSFGAPQQVPAAIQRDVTVARQNLGKVMASPPTFGSQAAIATAHAQAQAAIDTALANFNISDPESKQAISAALLDPENRGKSIDQVFDVTQMDQNELRELTNFITLIGGF